MERVLLSEFLANVNMMGLISNDYPLSTIGDPLLMDSMLRVNYGNKIVATNFLNVSKEMLSKMIVSKYANKWDSLKTALETKINILADNVQFTNENVKGDITTTDDRTTLDKVSAFNSESLVDNTGGTDNNVHTSNDARDRIQTVTNTNLNNAFNNLQIVNDLNIIETILQDTACYFTLDIY